MKIDIQKTDIGMYTQITDIPYMRTWPLKTCSQHEQEQKYKAVEVVFFKKLVVKSSLTYALRSRLKRTVVPGQRNQPANTDICQEIWGCCRGSHPNGTHWCNPSHCSEITNRSEEENPIFLGADQFFVSPRKNYSTL